MSSVKVASKKTGDIHNTLIRELRIELNAFHKISWNSLQYEKLLGNWLITFIQIIYERLHSCTEASNSPGQDCFWIPSTIIDIGKLATSDNVNSQIYRDLRCLEAGLPLGREINSLKKSEPVLRSFAFKEGTCPIHLHGAYTRM